MKKIVLTALIIMFSALSTYAEEYFVIADSLNMRLQPALNATAVKGLKYGDVVEIVETGKTDIVNSIGGHWIKINFEGKTGWCFDPYMIQYSLVKDCLNDLSKTPVPVKMFGKVIVGDDGNHNFEYKNSKYGNSVQAIIYKKDNNVDFESINSKSELIKEEVFIENGLNRSYSRIKYSSGTPNYYSRSDEKGDWETSLEDVTSKLSARELLVEESKETGKIEDFYLFYALFKSIEDFRDDRCVKPLVKKEKTAESEKTTKLSNVESFPYGFSYNKTINLISADTVEVLYVDTTDLYKKETFKLKNGKWMLNDLFYYGEEEEYGE